MNFLKFCFTVLAATFLFCGNANSAELTDKNKAEIKAFVREYLIENPDILKEMAVALEAKEKRAEEEQRLATLKDNADIVFKLAGDPIAGNPKGNVTVVEFMDYNCGWCKRSVDEISQLIQQDPNVRVVMKEFPIFGQGSEYAARAALASVKQGKYWELHQAMFKHEGQVTGEVVDQIAKELGLDVAKLKADMMLPEVLNNITANQELAKAMTINGTPAFVIDDGIEPGYVPLARLVERVAAVRANGCKYC